MQLKDIARIIKGELIQGNTETPIKGIAYDSRKVKQGDLFIGIRGYKADGHNYITQAVEKGAVAVVVERVTGYISVPVLKVSDSRRALALAASHIYGDPSSKFKLIGITGTNGKTTTTYLIKTILEQQGKKVGLIGTNQNMIGDKALSTERTTPESLELQMLFKEMVNEKVDFVVMEVSSHSLELNRVDGCNFEVGVFTNITQDHLDFHGTMDNYLKTKTKLFQRCKTGIINFDDKGSDYILQHGSCDIVTFGIERDADIQGKNIALSDKGIEFDLSVPQGQARMELAIPGKFSVYNALGSIGACLAVGVDLETIQQGLKEAEGVPGRAQIVETGKDFTVLIDYAHTPDGLENILNAVRGFAKGRVVTMFGCGGDRDRTKRPIMGKIAGNLSDFCIITSDNPRTEDPQKIIEHIEEGMKQTKCPYTVIENRYQAIKYVLEQAKKSDVIVLAGKGHETYQVLNDKVINFDEKEIIEELLNINEQN